MSVDCYFCTIGALFGYNQISENALSNSPLRIAGSEFPSILPKDGKPYALGFPNPHVLGVGKPPPSLNKIGRGGRGQAGTAVLVESCTVAGYVLFREGESI